MERLPQGTLALTLLVVLTGCQSRPDYECRYPGLGPQTRDRHVPAALRLTVDDSMGIRLHQQMLHPGSVLKTGHRGAAIEAGGARMSRADIPAFSNANERSLVGYYACDEQSVIVQLPIESPSMHTALQHWNKPDGITLIDTEGSAYPAVGYFLYEAEGLEFAFDRNHALTDPPAMKNWAIPAPHRMLKFVFIVRRGAAIKACKIGSVTVATSDPPLECGR